MCIRNISATRLKTIARTQRRASYTERRQREKERFSRKEEEKGKEEEGSSKEKRRRRKNPALRYEYVWSLLNFLHSKKEQRKESRL